MLFFANRGKDIVCAGVSAVSFGAINAIHALTGVTPVIEQEKTAFSAVLFQKIFRKTYMRKYNFFLKEWLFHYKRLKKSTEST